MYDLRHGLSNNLIRILGSYCDVLAHRYYCPPDPPPPGNMGAEYAHPH